MIRHRSLLQVLTVLATAALTAVACTPAASSQSATSASASAGGGAGATTVNVTLKEFEIVPDVTSAPAGDITFHVTNEGPDDVHEFVVFKTDLAPESLPTAEDGSVDEEGEGVEIKDEIEDIPVGESQDVTISLDAGSYVLICNIVEEDEVHFTLGMRTSFTVE
jgi:uncharacterized cupredoxin-like copper-binding protein